MGGGNSKDFKDIAQNSRLDEKELRELLKTFKSISKDGELSKDQLKKVIEKKYGFESTFALQVFNLFDKNGDKTINFTEFCLAYGYIVNKTLEDVVAVSFRCLDLNGDGFISKNELRSVVMMNKKMEKFSKVHKKSVPLDKINLQPIEISKINEEADGLFDLLDTNRDNQVSKEEFLHLTNTSPEIKSKLCSLLIRDDSLEIFTL
eukprot:gene2784-3459_t